MRVPSHVPLYPMRTVVRLTGVKPNRIRFWESHYGLVSPTRDESGRRLYSHEEVNRIRQIGQMVDDHGLSLLAIRRLLREQTVHA